MNRVVTAGLRQPWLVALMTLILIGVGVWSLQRLPVDAYPDLSPPMVELITQWPGHTSEEVERLITVPAEIEMNGLPGATVSRSISLYGLSQLVITYKDGTDRNAARQGVRQLRGNRQNRDGLVFDVDRATRGVDRLLALLEDRTLARQPVWSRFDGNGDETGRLEQGRQVTDAVGLLPSGEDRPRTRA